MTSTMTNRDIVAAFNKLRSKPYCSVKDIETGKPYKVLRMFRQNNKYGNVVIAELEEWMLYLPKRYNALEDAAIEGTSEEQFLLSKKTDIITGNYIIELEEISEYGNSIEADDDELMFIPNAQPYYFESNKKAKH